MKVVFAASEAAPFCASGGLGDVIGALPAAINRADRTTEASVILPLHRSVGEEYRRRMKPVFSGRLSLAWREIDFSVYGLSLSGVDFFFIEQPRYFDRPSLYGEFDDGERYAFLARAVLAFLLESGRIPDVLHLHDWQTALVSVYLRTLYANDPRASGIRTVLTVHNIDYQGKFDISILSDVLGLDPVHLPLLEYDGCLNFLKGGLVTADSVTTVSPRYAKELSSPEFGAGLSPLIGKFTPPLVGILNGIDGRAFSPRDPSLAAPYTATTLEEGKKECRRAAFRELSLPARGRGPLLLMISRLVEAKGVDLLLATAERILALGAYLVVLGTGEKEYEQALLALAEKYPQRVRVLLRFDRELSKKLYAAADIFLMPSRREPCGLAQMIACRYGTVPVVRAVGGLLDSIRPWGRREGIGFLFREDSAQDFYDAVADAVTLFRTDREAWLGLARAAMRADFSWRPSALSYLALYRALWEAMHEF